MAEMLMVFCYDVSSNRARRRVAGLLEDRCVRVQRSVFEARMSRTDAQRLARKAARELEPGDSLRVYAVTEAGLERSLAYGILPLPEAQDFYLL
jgi:CRISPR-associated protein Cas2